MRIVIIEDHEMYREVAVRVCNTRGRRHSVVGLAEDGSQGVALVRAIKPDLVILDLNFPNRCSGFSVLDRIRQFNPHVLVLVLSSSCNDYTTFRSRKSRVNGFVDKNTNTAGVLLQALDALDAGRAFFSQTFLAVDAARVANPSSFDKRLSDREQEILALMSVPMTIAEVAAYLGLSPATVERHRHNLCTNLGMKSTAEMIRYAHSIGITMAAPMDAVPLASPPLRKSPTS